MAGPWEKYQQPVQQADGPWAKYATEQAPEQGSGVGDVIQNAYGGYWEPLMSIGSGAVAAPVAGLAGIAQGAKNLIPGMEGMPAGSRVEQVLEAMTYQPRTEAGQAGMRVIGYPLQKLAQLGDVAGDVINQPEAPGQRISGMAANYGLEPVRSAETGVNPLQAGAAAAANTAVQVAPSLLLKARAKPAEVGANVRNPPSVGGAAPARAGAPQSVTVQGQSARLGQVPQAAAKKAAIRAGQAPTKEALKKASTAAYKRAEDAGAVISADSFSKAQQTIAKMLEKEGLDPTLHPSTTAALKRIKETGGPITLEKLETLRRIAKDAESSLSPADKRLAAKTVDTIDRYADTLGTRDLTAGSPAAVSALKEARNLYSRARKADVLDELMERAEISAPNFSASGMENAIRTEFRALAKNSRRMRLFTAEERAAIKKVAMGGPMENALRMVGKFAPTGVVSTALSTGLGFLAGGPAGAATLPALGGVARYGAAKMTMKNAARANELVRRGPMPRNALAEPVAIPETTR